MQDPEEHLTILSSLAHITRQVGSKLSVHFPAMTNHLAVYPASLKEEESVELDNEIAEAAMTCIENLVKKCPMQVKERIPELYKLARETIKYDPNYSGDGDDIDMTDVEDDGWGGSDYGGEEDMNDDDTAWKVRKASTKIVDALVLACPGQLKDYWLMFVDLMSDRFSERDSNVKCDIFTVF